MTTPVRLNAIHSASTFLVLVGLLLSACTPGASKDGFTLNGTLADYPSALVLLERVHPLKNQVVDSARTDEKGAFTISHSADSGGIYAIRLTNNQSILFCPGRDELRLDGIAGQLGNSVVTGNAASTQIQRFQQERNLLRAEFGVQNTLLRKYSQTEDPMGWQLQEARTDTAIERYREYVRTFIDTVKVPELAWFAATHLNPRGDFHFLRTFVDRRIEAGEKSEFLDHVDNALQEEGKNSIAFEVKDFRVQDARGDSMSLSDSRGKPTYLLVWASYCGFSRMETKRLSQWRHAHPDVPLEIRTISIDADETAWRKAVTEDSLDWPGQWRGGYAWGSPEIKDLDVQSIPTSYLLDAKGIIRSKNFLSLDLERDWKEVLEKWGK